MINTKKFNISFIVFFFLIILCIGLSSVKDYGVSSDEYSSRLKGFITLNYIGKIIIPEINEKYKKDKVLPDLHVSGLVKFYGPVFDASVAFIEVIFDIKDKKNQFLLKHYLNFFCFFC